MAILVTRTCHNCRGTGVVHLGRVYEEVLALFEDGKPHTRYELSHINGEESPAMLKRLQDLEAWGFLDAERVDDGLEVIYRLVRPR